MRKFEYPIKFRWDKEVQPDPFLISSIGGSGYKTKEEECTPSKIPKSSNSVSIGAKPAIVTISQLHG